MSEGKGEQAIGLCSQLATPLEEKQKKPASNPSNWKKDLRNSVRMNVTVQLLDDIVHACPFMLKVDVEGAEIEVLEGLAPLLPEVKVVYVEYDHRSHRRAIETLLGASHELYFAMLMTLDQGECMWVRRDLAEHPDALGHLRNLWTSLIAPR